MQEDLQKIQLKQLAAAVLLIFVFMIVACSFLIFRSEELVQDNMSRLVGTDTDQIELNVSNYLSRIEGTAQLMFTNEAYYAFDPTVGNLDAYEKLQAEDAIRDRIIDIGSTENFSDFGVVYANDDHVGWISQTTLGLFSNGGMYDEFAGLVTNEARQSGWSFGVRDNTDRLWYVKRLNDHAVLVMSVFASSLGESFTAPEGLGDATVRLVDRSNTVLYSKDANEVGTKLDDAVAALVGTEGSACAHNGQFFAASSTTENGWRVVVAASTDAVLAQGYSMRNVILLFFAFMIALFVLVAAAVYTHLSRPVDTLVDNLTARAASDQLTGLLNKVTYETIARQRIEAETEPGCFAYLILDVDHFKDINDRYGHAYGDEVLKGMGAALKTNAVHAIAAGRVGGDEFSAFAFFGGADADEAAAFGREAIDRIREHVQQSFAPKNRNGKPLTVSMGISVAPSGSMGFEDLYKAADTALYASKGAGRDCGTVTVFKEGSWR